MIFNYPYEINLSLINIIQMYLIHQININLISVKYNAKK